MQGGNSPLVGTDETWGCPGPGVPKTTVGTWGRKRQTHFQVPTRDRGRHDGRPRGRERERESAFGFCPEGPQSALHPELSRASVAVSSSTFDAPAKPRTWTHAHWEEARRLQPEGMSWASIAEQVCGDRRYKSTVQGWLRAAA